MPIKLIKAVSLGVIVLSIIVITYSVVTIADVLKDKVTGQLGSPMNLHVESPPKAEVSVVGPSDHNVNPEPRVTFQELLRRGQNEVAQSPEKTIIKNIVEKWISAWPEIQPLPSDVHFIVESVKISGNWAVAHGVFVFRDTQEPYEAPEGVIILLQKTDTWHPSYPISRQYRDWLSRVPTDILSNDTKQYLLNLYYSDK